MADKKWQDTSLSFEERTEALISEMTVAEKASQLLHESPSLPKHGIHQYNWWNECLHGVGRAGKATVFPQAIGIAATFDRNLVFNVASAIADEARAKHHEAARKNNRKRYKGLTFWTPNINIFRDPRWGRGQETYGEDPLLTAEIGKQFVKGLQGDHPKYMKVAACAKHFAVHSGPEKNRHSFNAVATPQDMTDTYLPAFKALVDEGVEAVMGAYNRTNGEPCCGSKTLLVDLLRGEWGFKGHVVSDCWAVRDFHAEHKVTSRPEESVALAIKNGCDLNCGCTYEYILSALDEGLITEEDINACLKRTLTARFKLGMFDPEESVPYASTPMTVVNCEKHRELALECAEKSIVLLRNENNVLPVTEEKYQYIMVQGPAAMDLNVLYGNYHGMSGSMTSFLEGITDRCPESIAMDFRIGCMFQEETKNDRCWHVGEAKNADLLIACFGLCTNLENEEGDAVSSKERGDRDTLALPQVQRDYLDQLAEIETPVVLVVTGGSPVDLSDYVDKFEAILYVWYPGERGGTALANILFGDTVPSGKLPVTFPKSLEELPGYEDYSMEGRTYKYTKTEPLFPFGFGLSYTNFDFSELTVDNPDAAQDEIITGSVCVTNTGERIGEEVVQFYIRKQADGYRCANSELFHFDRVSLQPGKSERVFFKLSPEQRMLTAEDGKKVNAPANLTLFAGNSSPGFSKATLVKADL